MTEVPQAPGELPCQHRPANGKPARGRQLIIVLVRKDATPEEISGAFDRVRTVVQEAGLAA